MRGDLLAGRVAVVVLHTPRCLARYACCSFFSIHHRTILILIISQTSLPSRLSKPPQGPNAAKNKETLDLHRDLKEIKERLLQLQEEQKAALLEQKQTLAEQKETLATICTFVQGPKSSNIPGKPGLLVIMCNLTE